MEPHLVTWHPVGKTPQVSIGAGQSWSYPHYSYLAPSARKELVSSLPWQEGVLDRRGHGASQLHHILGGRPGSKGGCWTVMFRG